MFRVFGWDRAFLKGCWHCTPPTIYYRSFENKTLPLFLFVVSKCQFQDSKIRDDFREKRKKERKNEGEKRRRLKWNRMFFKWRDSRNSAHHGSHRRAILALIFQSWRANRAFRLEAPYARSLLIPVKFNGVDSAPNRLTQLSSCSDDAVTEPIRIRRVQTAIRGHVHVGGVSKTLSREREDYIYRRWPSLIRVLCFLVINNVACQVCTEDATLICIYRL